MSSTTEISHALSALSQALGAQVGHLEQGLSDIIRSAKCQPGRVAGSAICNRLGRLRRRAVLATGLGLVTAVLLAALIGVVAPPYEPIAMDVPHRLQPPDLSHPFGTDQYGRDILSRVLSGASVAISVGLVALGIAIAVGVPLGAVAGYRRGWLGEVIMRAMDALFAFPSLLLAIAVIAALGPGHIQAMLAIGVVNIPVFARITHGMVLTLREKDFVLAARAIGVPPRYILWRHILPNALSPLLVQAGAGFAGALLAEASLSYLGLGTQPPLPSWGLMLEEARTYMDLAPWMAIFPGFAIATAILGFNLLSDGLRDFLNPEAKDSQPPTGNRGPRWSKESKESPVRVGDSSATPQTCPFLRSRASLSLPKE